MGYSHSTPERLMDVKGAAMAARTGTVVCLITFMAAAACLVLQQDESLLPDSFSFRQEKANPFYCLSQFYANCEVHIVKKPERPGELRFRFVRAGKEILNLAGHPATVFSSDADTLFFAHFSDVSMGCTIAAYDLNDGSLRWKTELKGVNEELAHLGYVNKVTMGLSSRFVSITGQESYGDYVEILDRKTGALRAHKVYRKGYK
jgi:hypothetical protein